MHTDIEIFDMGDGWSWSGVSPANRQRPPLTFIGERLTRRLWRADGLADDLWDAAKEAWLRAVSSLSRLDTGGIPGTGSKAA